MEDPEDDDFVDHFSDDDESDGGDEYSEYPDDVVVFPTVTETVWESNVTQTYMVTIALAQKTVYEDGKSLSYRMKGMGTLFS